MSFSYGKIGTTAQLAEDLKAESARLTGASKTEFDAALPHVQGLLALNKPKDPAKRYHLEMTGHGWRESGGASGEESKVFGEVSVKLYPTILPIL